MRNPTCAEMFAYVMKTLTRVGGGNVSIYGKLPDRCVPYFEQRGLRVIRKPFGYTKFVEMR